MTYSSDFLLTGIIVFMLGISMGSFFNVIIDRMPRNEDITTSRSRCVFCNTNLKWFDLIPLISFILLKSRCRYCNKKLSIQYIISEFTVGVMFLISYIMYGRCMQYSSMLLYMTLWSMLYITAIIDYKHGIIIESIIIIFSIIGIFIRFIEGITLINIFSGGVVGVLFYGSIYLLAKMFYKKEGFGLGDVELLGAIGLFIGPLYVFITGWIAFYICGFTLVCVKMVNRNIDKFDEIYFAPYICIATFIITLFGDKIILLFMNYLFN